MSATKHLLKALADHHEGSEHEQQAVVVGEDGGPLVDEQVAAVGDDVLEHVLLPVEVHAQHYAGGADADEGSAEAPPYQPAPPRLHVSLHLKIFEMF